MVNNQGNKGCTARATNPVEAASGTAGSPPVSGLASVLNRLQVEAEIICELEERMRSRLGPLMCSIEVESESFSAPEETAECQLAKQLNAAIDTIASVRSKMFATLSRVDIY